ncbi:MAG: DUF4412 domain-containing protein [Spirochaetes bacterium]|nr:DUF4412 domain-containing protein [Spirochaetota bacterium]
MKKTFQFLWVITFAAVIAVSLISCGKKSDTSDGADGKAGSFFKMFSSGTYHMKAKMAGGGMGIEMESFVKGGDSATIMKVIGQNTRMVSKDKKMYMINDSAKTVTVIPVQTGSSEDPIKTDGMKLTGSGTAKFNGKDLPYEEYSDGKGNKVQYFLDGSKLAGIRNIINSKTVDIVILVLDQDVPAGVFDIPSGYKQVGAF